MCGRSPEPPAAERHRMACYAHGTRVRRCRRPVKVSAAQFEVLERMHYVCFHYEFEHGEFDVDEECTAGGCPSTSLAKGSRAVLPARKRPDRRDTKTSDDPYQHPAFIYLMACGVPPIVILGLRIQDGSWAHWTTVLVLAIAVASGQVVAWLWIRLFGTTPSVDAPCGAEDPARRPGSPR